MKIEDLNLADLDALSAHLVSGPVVRAVAMAARAGHTDQMATRLVAALFLTNCLTEPGRWHYVLRAVMDLTEKETTE